MSAMLAAVLMFAVVNFGLKASGPVLLGEARFPDRLEAAIVALPAALLAGMLVSALFGERWQSLDPAILVGLGGAAVVWSLRGGQLASVFACLAITITVRWVF